MKTRKDLQVEDEGRHTGEAPRSDPFSPVAGLFEPWIYTVTRDQYYEILTPKES